jgi:hypothetical protein
MSLTEPGRVPGHEFAATSRPRRALAAVLTRTRLWSVLPGRAQGAVCGCPTCRGPAVKLTRADLALNVAGVLLNVLFLGSAAVLITAVVEGSEPLAWDALVGFAAWLVLTLVHDWLLGRTEPQSAGES